MIVMQPGQGMNTGNANCTCELDGTNCCDGDTLCYVPVGYLAGRQPPRYPVPATNANADVAINWTCIHFCQCNACLDKYMDGLEVEFPDAFN